jgi:hypothetical protein
MERSDRAILWPINGRREKLLSSACSPENGTKSWIAFRYKLIDMAVAPLISRLENFGMSVEIDNVRARERGRSED